ncbi:hypothetical protein LJR029_005481 [Caballeronia sp. LjRoot29]|uniref:hypothetical protein n=1 Tax=Caballeronia sp. LjRoot29 TaxID=3342315 RepID=UPI003ECE46B3
MRRVQVFAGALPLETDILNTNKGSFIAIGHVLQDMLGTGTLFSGLGCVPTGPAGMTVNVNPGRAYSLQATDTGAYSSLSADATPLVKQGILLSAVNFACPAPTTAGFSINYLIEGAFQEVDGGPVTLPYYNAANPAVAFSGPNGTGTSNNTYRDNTVQLQLKPGAAATTGSQVTPTPDAGFNGLWVVTVPFGATTITSANISQYTGAPFLSNNLLSQIQAVPTTGRLLNTQVFPSTGTYTPTPGATFAIVDVQGSGGQGGGSNAATSTTVSFGTGGHSGPRAVVKISLAGITTVPVTVGVGGSTGAAAAAGQAGGTTSFGTYVSCPGGPGGNVLGPTAGPLFSGNTSALPSASVSGVLQTILAQSGNAGPPSVCISAGAAGSGAGGISPGYGGGVTISGGTGPGNPGQQFGQGGSGAFTATSGAAQIGGAGLHGYVIVWEFA